ncbi:hypothetical protein HON36_03840 [Candidatus Parcubacteria bacterium]|jgi:hypothetical protein|nr:hypothetical protein [Candidatus Parcubacteria bacterium]MBT7228994.1 hypothetical protein [Candidatus Parcubacteria bacterium]
MFGVSYITDCKEFGIVIADIKSEIASLGIEISALQSPIDDEDQIWERKARIGDKKKWAEDSIGDLLFGKIRAEFDHIDGKKISVVNAKEVELGGGHLYKVGDRIGVVPKNKDFVLKHIGKIPKDIKIVGFSDRGGRIVIQIDGDKVVDFGPEIFTSSFEFTDTFNEEIVFRVIKE